MSKRPVNKPAVPFSKPTSRFRASLIALIVVVILIAGGLIGYKIYHNYQISQDRARFVQAEKDVDEVSQAIQKAVGQPAKVESKKYCSKPSRKFDDGKLFCVVDETIYLDANDIKDANRKLQSINEVPTKFWKLNVMSNDRVHFAIENNPQTYQQLQTKYTPNHSSFECTINKFIYTTNSKPYNSFYTNNSEYTMAITIDCSDFAKSEYYPLR